MRRILVPPRPGAFSALGLLCTDVVHDYIRSELRPLADVDAEHAEDDFRRARSARRARSWRPRAWTPATRALRARARPALHRPGLRAAHAARWPVHGAADGGIARGRARALRRAPRADPRPRRQGAAGRGGELSPARARRRCRNTSRAQEAAPPSPRRPMPRARAARAFISTARRAIEATLYERDRLDVGATIAGPAIVEQFDATTVIPPGWTARGRRLSAILILRTESASPTMHGRHHHPDPAQQDREPGR